MLTTGSYIPSGEVSLIDDCSKKIISGLLKARSDLLEGSRMSLKDNAVLSEISKAKAKEESPDGMAMRAATDPSSSTSTLAVIAEVRCFLALGEKMR